MVGSTALAQLHIQLLAVAVPASLACASAHALCIVRMLLVARESPVRAAMRGRASLRRIRAQLPPRAQPVGSVCTHALRWQWTALCIFSLSPAEAAEALILAASGREARLVFLRAELPTRALPTILFLACALRHWPTLRKMLPHFPLAPEVATGATCRVVAVTIGAGARGNRGHPCQQQRTCAH